MDAQDWKEFKEQGKAIRNNRLQRHTTVCHFAARKLGLKMENVQPHQIRLSDKNLSLVVDIFPMGKKYHNITHNKRGTYFHLTSFIYSLYGQRKGHKQ